MDTPTPKPTASYAKTGTARISSATFVAWHHRYLERNQTKTIERVSLSSDPASVYIERKQLLTLLETVKEDYVVFMFGCQDAARKYAGLTVNVCGMRAPGTLIALNQIYATFAAGTTYAPKPIPVHDLATGYSHFTARNASLATEKPVLTFSNEFSGYAHDPKVLLNWINNHPEYTHVAIYFGVNDDNRTTVMLVGSVNFKDNVPPVDRTGKRFLMVAADAQAAQDDSFEGYDNGMQCCPIPR
jgi:hypothetical protein